MDRNELIDKLKPYFKIQELVCPHCYSKFGETSWQFISTELLSTLYILRTKIFNKPITINTWKAGGQFSQRGLRCNMCQLVKSKSSIYLSALEANTDGWSHCDCYVPYNSKEKIVIFTA